MQGGKQILPGHLATGKGIEEGAHGTDAAAFVGGADTGHDAAEYQHEQRENRHEAHGGLNFFSQRILGAAGSKFRMTHGHVIDVGHEHERQHDTGNQTGHEQSADGNFRNDAVDDEA